MDERAALVAAIAANPEDDTPRLALADWLQEHGEDDRAEFIRSQCELWRPRTHGDTPRSQALVDRCTALLATNWKRWFTPLLRALGADEPDPLLGKPYHPPGRVGGAAQISREPTIATAPPHQGTYFLERLLIERGFASQVSLATRHCTRPCSFAEAVRHEPITEIEITLPTDPPNGRDFLEHSLEQIRALSVYLDGPDHPSLPGGLTAFLHCSVWSGLTSFRFGRASGPGLMASSWIERVLDCPWVERLTSFSAGLTDAGLKVLVQSGATNLTSLSLAHSELSVDSTGSLGALSCHPRLKSLNLSRSGLRSRHVSVLAASGNWDCLEELDLSNNPIRDEGVHALVASGLLARVRRLNLSATELNVDGILAVARAVDPERVEVLNLNYNQLDPVFEVSLRKRFGDRIQLDPDD